MKTKHLTQKQLETIILNFMEEWKKSELATQMARNLAMASLEGCPVDRLLLHIHATCTAWAIMHFDTLYAIKLVTSESDALAVCMLKEIFMIFASFQFERE